VKGCRFCVQSSGIRKTPMEEQSSGAIPVTAMPAAAWDLVTLWSDVWDAPRFRGEDRVQKPVLTREALAPLLKLAASCVVALQENFKGTSQVPAHGAYGASRELLVSAIEGAGGAVSDPHGLPAEFVRALAKSAFMTGDGEFTEGLSEEQLDRLLDKHCASQLEQAASLAKDPTANLRCSWDKLRTVVQEVLETPPEEGDIAGVANRLLLVQRLERAAEDAHHILAAAKEAQEASSAESSLEALDTENSTVDEAPNGDSEASPEEPPNPLKRSKSQAAAKLKVQKVKQHQEDMSKEVYDLSRTTSALQKREACQSQDEKENESDKLRAELTAVEEARKKARNFGEDLLEDMMALDDLSGLSEEDRSTRKAALAGLEGLLQDVDTAKSRLAMLHRQLEGKLKKAEEKKQAEERVRKAEEEKRAQEAAAEKAAAEAAAPPEAPEEALASARRRAKEGKEAAASALEPPAPGKEVWQQVRLPLRFHSREEPSNYVISATVPGLDLDDLKLELVDSSTTLRVEGLRLPSSKEAATMRKRIAAKIRQVAQRSPEKFAMMVKALPQVAADAYLELGQGEYGRFAETFQLPSDVDVENIEASYTDGVLRIVLPKVQRPSATAFNPRARGPAPAPRRPMHPGLGRGAHGPWGGSLFGGHDDYFRW